MHKRGGERETGNRVLLLLLCQSSEETQPPWLSDVVCRSTTSEKEEKRKPHGTARRGDQRRTGSRVSKQRN